MDRQHESKQVGRRLLLNYIDAVAIENPTKAVITQFITFEPDVQFTLTYQDLSNIINRLAWWLDESLQGKSKGATVAVPIHEHLIKETGSPAILFDPSFSSTVTELTNVHEIITLEVPGLVDFLSNTSRTKDYPYPDTFENASNKPLVVFHTSGSTGMPKPVTFVHSALAASDNLRTLFSEDTYRVSAHRLLETAQGIYNGCPLFHLAGFVAGFFGVFSGTILVIGPPSQPSSPQMFKSILHSAQVDGALLPPLVVDQIAQEPALVDKVSKLKFITFGGGSVSQTTGDLLSQKTKMINVLGSSECGLIGVFMAEPENWNWFHFADKALGIHWEPIDEGTDGKPEYYELVLRRDNNLAQKQAVFQNFPHLDEWRTKDIFRRHPTIPYYHMYQSRIDDVVVFSTGEKMNPISVEAGLNALPGVHAGLVVGHKRPYPVLLIELAPPATAEETLPAIYAALEELNKLSPKYAQVHPNDILIAALEKPFARTPKGTINRSQTGKLYETEIEALYNASTEIPVTLQAQIDPSTDKTLVKSIAEFVGGLTGVKEMDINDDFFASGLDSRQVQMLAASVARALENQKDVLFLRNAVYMNPTAQGLVDHIRQDKADDISEIVDEIFKKYSSSLPKPPKGAPQTTKDTHHVLVTGTTGFVGSFILTSLLKIPTVTEITCLNRRLPDSPINSASTKVNHFKADLSQPSFGLPEEDYLHLVSTVTEIIHCQWPVTFNLPLALFEPHIAGVANLVNLAYTSPNNTKVVFLSSIATIQGWSEPAPVPEAALDSLAYAQGGYGQSKMLASKLLGEAAIRSGVPTAVCRVGQVGGPVNSDGVWPKRDWFPTLLRASQIMGVLPRSLGHFNEVDWLPVDSLSEGLVTLALGDLGHPGSALEVETGGASYYHFTNPSTSSYTTLIPSILRRLGSQLSTVDTLAEWNERLTSWTKSDADNAETESAMAAATALLEFYQGLASNLDQPDARLDTTITVEKIPLLSEVGAVNEAWMEIWLGQWGFGKLVG
ncbi:NRPS-like enzyme [Aspergillus ustus]|uniref:NRPS-like enzyme n=1 Tax=Aspergillus ustus TaxID=40382 RepID=A0A0C1BWH0_ASPUT|nr:NRPS-like enzyme [Aspergillus ustus]